MPADMMRRKKKIDGASAISKSYLLMDFQTRKNGFIKEPFDI